MPKYDWFCAFRLKQIKLCSFFIEGIMLTFSSFRYNCFKVLQKKAEPRHSDDETPVKLGRTCVILSTPTINHFFKKLGTSSIHKISPPP